MSRNWPGDMKSVFKLCLATLVLLSSSVLAQTDPEGSQHAWNLYLAELSKDTATFRLLLEKDAALSQRAFLATLEYAESNAKRSPGDAKRSLDFAQVLAGALQDLHKDATPLDILGLYKSGDSRAENAFLDYAAKVFPQYTRAPEAPLLQAVAVQSDLLVQMSPAVTGANQRYLLKLARILMAGAYSDLRLLLSELQTHELALQEYVSVLKAHQSYSTAVQALLEEYSVAVEISKLAVYTEMGLLDEFDLKSGPLLAQKTLGDYRIPSYLLAFRVAHRQGENERAKRYLNEAAKIQQESGDKANLVYAYVLKTGEFQLRQASGEKLSKSETLRCATDSWAELKGFDPVLMMEESAAWQQGRHSTSFWIEEVAQLGPEGLDVMKVMVDSYDQWIKRMLTPEFTRRSQNNYDDRIFLKLQGVEILRFSILDAFLQISEHIRENLTTETVVTYRQQLDGMLASFDLYDYNLEGPAFPPFRLKQAPYLRELSVQMDYLGALVPGLSDQVRSGALSRVYDSASVLTRAEPYIQFYIKLGHRWRELDKTEQAISSWERALAKAEEHNFTRFVTIVSSLLAKEFARAENWEKVSYYAAKASQSFRGDVGQQGQGQQPQEAVGVGHLAVQAHIKSDKPEAALEVLNQSHQATTAAAQLSSNPEAASAQQSLGEKKKKVAVLTQKVQTLRSLPESETRNEILGKTEKLLAQTRSEFLSQSRKIRQQYSRLYTTALRFDPLNLPDIQAALPQGAAVVQYFSTDDELFIFVVTPSQFRLRSVPLSKADLDSSVLAYLRRIQRPILGDAELKAIGGKLYQALVAPIEADIQSAQTVILIPSGKLNVLPFAALPDTNGKPFLESKTLLELAKTTDFMKIAQTSVRPVSKVIAFANATSDLPAAEREGESILRVFPDSKLFVGAQASKANLLKFGRQAEVLHLATHGTWDAANSLNNHLKLSNREKLGQDEIFNLDLGQTSIVTLSACSTALGDLKETEYVASLAEAFWIAGSRSVVASLWPVDDESTGLLMTEFYKRLKAGDGKALALQKAQLAIRSNPKYAHPYFWSGFLLFGDYR